MTCCLFDITDSQYVLGLEMENNENLQLCWDSTTKLLLSTVLYCLIMAQRRRLVNILSKTAPLVDGQMEAIKRETADMQMKKGEKI